MAKAQRIMVVRVKKVLHILAAFLDKAIALPFGHVSRLWVEQHLVSSNSGKITE